MKNFPFVLIAAALAFTALFASSARGQEAAKAAVVNAIDIQGKAHAVNLAAGRMAIVAELHSAILTRRAEDNGKQVFSLPFRNTKLEDALLDLSKVAGKLRADGDLRAAEGRLLAEKVAALSSEEKDKGRVSLGEVRMGEVRDLLKEVEAYSLRCGTAALVAVIAASK